MKNERMNEIMNRQIMKERMKEGLRKCKKMKGRRKEWTKCKEWNIESLKNKRKKEGKNEWKKERNKWMNEWNRNKILLYWGVREIKKIIK